MKNRFMGILWDPAVVVFGCAVYAVSFNWFFRTNEFVMGGFTGVAQILNRLIPGLPVGTVVFFMNLPLILLFVKKEGLSKLWLTVFAIAVSSALIDSVGTWFRFQPVDDLLAFICGGVLMGLSLGLLLRKNATTGGTELAARLLQLRFRHLSIGRICLIIDVSIITAYALVFRELDNALYGTIAMVIASRVMDMVIYGSVNAKLAVIISDRCDAITEKLMAMDMGATVLEGRGAYTGSGKNVILCVFKHPRIAAIKAAAIDLDPDVFFIICDAREVLGKGFSPIK